MKRVLADVYGVTITDTFIIVGFDKKCKVSIGHKRWDPYMTCALLKTVVLIASVLIAITDVCDAISNLYLSDHNNDYHMVIFSLVSFSLIYLINPCRWLNWEDPLINHKSWTAKEDKNLLHLVQEKGIDNWFNIAVLLGTNRTPFQCLARYQRSLNASILKREWTKDEDARLRSAVEALGEGDWQSVASALEGRTGSQCSNRLVFYECFLFKF